MGREVPGPRRPRGLRLGRRPDRLHRLHRGVGESEREGLEALLVRRQPGHALHRRRHHLPPLIFWPALLKGAGYGVPHAIVASGMVKVDDHKFSKSRGYVVWTNDDYLDKGLPADYLRYYLLAYTSHTKELNFSWKVFCRADQQRGRQHLRQLRVPHALLCPEGVRGHPARCGRPGDHGRDRKDPCDRRPLMRDYEFKGAVDAIMALAAFGNTYIQTNAPWKLIKTDRAAAAQVIRNCRPDRQGACAPHRTGDARCSRAVLEDARVLRQRGKAPDQRCHATRCPRRASAPRSPSL